MNIMLLFLHLRFLIVSFRHVVSSSVHMFLWKLLNLFQKCLYENQFKRKQMERNC